ncbi:MAG: hypothetical protein Solumvirus8_4 [Solumvirus sp.]|uniref:Uncharacterized protein n=1 Tax=Solumvirus sp. TaxID=2487773 RepID=A0A3G5AKI4_9VIRU|nr:MAG: hypothetical protein Solumvirus8_4 [Solumvirus sp.]
MILSISRAFVSLFIDMNRSRVISTPLSNERYSFSIIASSFSKIIFCVTFARL